MQKCTFFFPSSRLFCRTVNRSTMPASDTLRELIRRSDLPLRHIAKKAKVDRFALSRWYRGTQPSIKLDHAERVYKVLTGDDFLR